MPTHYLGNVDARIKAIAAAADDPEQAHYLEDTLYFDALREIAEGINLDPQKLAKRVLRTRKLDFPRWYS